MKISRQRLILILPTALISITLLLVLILTIYPKSTGARFGNVHICIYEELHSEGKSYYGSLWNNGSLVEQKWLSNSNISYNISNINVSFDCFYDKIVLGKCLVNGAMYVFLVAESVGGNYKFLDLESIKSSSTDVAICDSLNVNSINYLDLQSCFQLNMIK